MNFSADGTAAIAPAKLRELPLLQNVPDDLLAETAALFTTHTLEAGRELFRAGDPADNFYLIVRGRVGAYQMSEGSERCLRVMEAGDVFGEIALLRDTPRTATIRGLALATLLVLSREHFQRLVARSPKLRRALGELADARMQNQPAGAASQPGTK